MKTACAFAPATIANVSVGFDVLGLALNTIGDKVEVTFNNTSENVITEMLNGEGLPQEPEKNCCTVVIREMQAILGDFKGVDVRIKKGFASSSGLGSSSASSAAAAHAYNQLVGEPFDSNQLIAFAALGEKAACGSAHVDNVAPAILGGLVLAKNSNPVEFIRLPILENLYVVTFFPQIKISSSDSRGILKKTVPVDVVSKQVSLMGTFVASLYQNDLELFSHSLQDLIVEPIRSQLIPKFQEMRLEATKNGALAFGISGSGPTVFAFASSKEAANEIKNALETVYVNTGITTQSNIDVLSNTSGTRVAVYND